MILLIDDERRDMARYIDELRASEYKVEFRKDIGVAQKYLIENLKTIELLILDIMMPSGKTIDKGTSNNGLRTGVRFFENIRQFAPELPVLILTNVSDPTMFNRFKKEPNCWFIRKENCLPFELADVVKQIFKEITASKTSKERTL